MASANYFQLIQQENLCIYRDKDIDVNCYGLKCLCAPQIHMLKPLPPM